MLKLGFNYYVTKEELKTVSEFALQKLEVYNGNIYAALQAVHLRFGTEKYEEFHSYWAQLIKSGS